MNGNRACAWVVAVAKDESVENAVATGETLRKTKSCGLILALVSNSVSKSYISLLESVYALVIVKDVESLATELKHSNHGDSEMEAFLISTLNMTTFSKLVVVRPGVMILRQSDELFDSENLVILDKNENWNGAVISPDKIRYTKIKELLGRKSFTWTSSSDIMNLVFSVGKWERFTDHNIVYKEKAALSCPPLGMLPDVEDTAGWVAIVGMSCRFPGANSPQEYWDLLASGQHACTFPPDHRRTLVDLDPKIKANFLKCPIDQFDAAFFGFSPSEATFTDPQARLLLEVSWEAFEDAAMNPDKLEGTETGVFYGSWLQEYRDAINADGSPANEDFIRKYLGNSFGCSAAKLSFFYGFTGPNVSTESGCSSSMVAVDLAIKSLQKRECPVAIVAGTNILLHMNIKQKVLWAEDGKSKTFDSDANGYARAEGIAVLILKRFSDAKRDGDRVHAIIRGSALSQEGLSKSFGTPTIDSECAAMRGALKKSGLKPEDVDFVEAHATGTTVGDPIEAQAIVKAYATESGSQRATPLYIGSGKTNVGHTESCSGMAGIFKVVLAMKHQLIPAHLHLKKINPQVNFDPIQGIIPVEAVPWPIEKNGKPRIAGVSSFGITGTDVHVIIQEAPFEQEVDVLTEGIGNVQPSISVLTLSAKSESALQELTHSYLNHLESSMDSLENIAYTANSCRPHHPLRMAVLGRTKQELRTNLIEGNILRGKASTPKICFTFPGRIGQMDLEPARILYASSPVFKSSMDYCDKLFQATTGNSMMPLLNNLEEDILAKGVTWYALIPAVQHSLVKLWASWGIYPDCVMGHCIGEISAAVVSGALPLENIFKLVKCMEYFLKVGKEQPALMMAIQASADKVNELISLFLENNNKDDESKENHASWIDVASSNAFDQTVIAGDKESVGKFKELLISLGYRCKHLTMDFCAHSRAVEPACQKSLHIFEGISHEKMKIPYVSSVTGKVIRDEEMGGQFWYNVFRQGVNFTSSCQTTSSSGLADVYIEMGLEGALSRLTQENLAAMKTPTASSVCLPSLWKVKGDKCWAGLLSSLGQLYALGGNVDWDGFYGSHNINGLPYKRVQLPSYPFQRKSFWYERRMKQEERINHDQSCLKTQSTGQRFHPLLGVAVETCLADRAIFQNWIVGGESSAQYVYDHVIGTKVIFPGAAFLEMILAGVSHASGTDDGSIVNVMGFTVSKPLHLEELVPQRLQCVMDKSNQSGNVYAMHVQNTHEESNGSSWQLHASGEYSVVKEEEGDLLNALENFEELKRQCVNSESETNNFYLAAELVGLKFGNDFRSMKRIKMETGENGTEILIEIGLPPGEETKAEYVCHPILIDAMIQGLILHTKPELKRLHVPVHIGKFSVRKGMFQSGGAAPWYVYCKTDQQSGLTKHVYLLHETGVVVAAMTNAELVMTSVDSVLKAAGCLKENEETEEMNPVALYQFDVVFNRSQLHQSANSIKIRCFEQDGTKRSLDNLQDVMDKRNMFTEEESKLDKNMNRLCYLYVVKMLHEFGWLPSNGIQDLASSNVAEKWGIIPGLIPAFKHFVSFIDSKTLMETTDDYGQLVSEIKKILIELKDYPALKTVQACGSHLGGILRGTINPRLLLFGGGGGGGGGDSLAEHFYKTTRFASIAAPVKKVFPVIQEQIQLCIGSSTETLRILEVGAGTGGFANEMVRYFEEPDRPRHEYTFSDISPSFLVKAKERFEGKPFQFRTFNIEMDPLKQGFCPGYFDIVVAIDVVHATRNVKESLKNLGFVTKPGGWILLAETEKPVREVDICFGGLEGYWLFEDGIRKEHCTIRGEKWLELLKENGFSRGQGKFLCCNSQMSIITAQKEENEVTDEKSFEEICCQGNWIVFFYEDDDKDTDFARFMEHFAWRMSAVKRKVTLVPLNNLENLEQNINKCFRENQDHNVLEGIIFWFGRANPSAPPESQKILEPMLYVGKYLLQRKWKVLPKFHVVTKECQSTGTETEIGAHGYSNPRFAQAWGFMRNLRIEIPGILSKSIDMDCGGDMKEQCVQLMTELWLDDKETEVVFRGSVRFVRRALQKNDTQEDVDVGIYGNGKYITVQLPKSKMIGDVKFVPLEKPLNLAADEILVELKSVSLNFKDVLAVMKPSTDFDNLTSIGLDFSGVVISTGDQVTKWKVGQPVFGCGWEQGAMKSHLITKEEAMVSVPEWMTFNEAATLPAVFLTAWYCMVKVAKLQKGQTMLLHAASGGVGLIAIQIAKLLGVQVIGTAGTEKKRNFVKSLGVDNVFNSRCTKFGQNVQQITQGNGVDMVLNCLTGPGFKEASLEVCKDGGHFVEISKMDTWTPAQVQQRRPGVNYTVVDATQLDKGTLEDVMNTLSRLLATGTIKPLPYTQYSAFEIKDALNYLQKAKQIGKVIVTMPRYVENIRGAQYHPEYLFNDKSSYLITGGKGSIGISVAKWMATQGAKYLVLVGRSVATETVQQAIHEMEQRHGTVVICKEVDITDMEQCRNLVQQFDGKMPPLRGIHHCAGILSDKLLSQQENWYCYEKVVHPKVQGAWNLHQLTMDLPIEFFVMYSSAASTCGNIGQSNYVAANCYLDALAEIRVAMGLPCLSINWGQWNMGFAKDLSVDWLHPFTADEGTTTLEILMRKKNRPTVMTGLFDYNGLLRMTPYFADTFLETLCLEQASFSGRGANNSRSLKKSAASAKKVLLVDLYLRMKDDDEKNKLVKDFVVRILCETLGTKPEDINDEDQHFSEMGMDSLMSIEFANKINCELEGGSGGGGGYIDLEECGTVNKMTELISETLAKLIP